MTKISTRRILAPVLPSRGVLDVSDRALEMIGIADVTIEKSGAQTGPFTLQRRFIWFATPPIDQLFKFFPLFQRWDDTGLQCFVEVAWKTVCQPEVAV